MKSVKMNVELNENVKDFLMNFIDGCFDGWEEGDELDFNIDLEEGIYFEDEELKLGLELRDIIGDNKLIGEFVSEFNENIIFEVKKFDDLLLEGSIKFN